MIDQQAHPEIHQCFSLALSWNWPFDEGFVSLLRLEASEQKVSLFEITPKNLNEVKYALEQCLLDFDTFLDRAADDDPRFSAFCEWATGHCKHVFNPREKAILANDKVLMHHAMIQAGLSTPCTIILPPFRSHPAPPEIDHTFLNRPMTLKPSHGGGSEGVIMGVSSLDQVQSARQQSPEDSYLLQASILPTYWAGKQAWFRVLYCCGSVFPCRWNTETHIYTQITSEEESLSLFTELNQIVHRIAASIELELFSTEIVLTEQKNFVIVDYVNDPLDLRLQSEACDGVPNEIVAEFARVIIAQANHHSSS